VGFLLVLAVVCLLLLVLGPPDSIETWLALLFFPVLTVLIPIGYYKEIEFGATELRVKRYVIPDRIIEYSQIRHLSPTAIDTTGRGLHWRNMKNGDEIKEIFDRLVEEGKINEAQFDESIPVQNRIQAYTIAIAFMPGIILGGFVVYLGLYTSYSSILPAQVFRSELRMQMFMAATLGGCTLLCYLACRPFVARYLAAESQQPGGG
jgi:hypothetical protein